MTFRLRALALLSVGLAFLGLALVSAPEAQAQGKKAEFKQVTFKTFDGVELSGYFYPNPTGKKNATVLMLHNFHPKKGGNQKKDGWEDLAARLQKEGYAVLTFDFRGFGDSKTVDPAFWMQPHNGLANIRRRGAGKAPPANIDHKDFTPGYYRYLVNDIAAAKAYLDRRNDDAELNTSSTIVIGAENGATLGALWMAHECRLKRDKNPTQFIGGGYRPNLADSEGKDLACAVWLSISPSLAGSTAPVGSWLKSVGKDSKVPMYFIYGSQDARSKTFAQTQLKIIRGAAVGKKEKGALTGQKELKTKLAGSALLQSKLDTAEYITGYLELVMEKRGDKERRTRAIEKWRFFYDFSSPKGVGRAPVLVKPLGEDVMHVDPRVFFPIR